MASTLSMANQNSSSPKSFTDSRFTTRTKLRAISAVTHWGKAGAQ